MTPGAFIAKWRASELKESAAAQEHFIDLCRLLGEPTPAEADPAGEWYCFEHGARKDTGGDGWADVWKRGCFAWEYKGKRADLDAAFDQLRQYALALDNPPLLIVSDMARFRIRTNWTNSVSAPHEFALDDLADAANRDKLKWAMSDPERQRPGESRQALTERAAATFADLARSLRERGHDPQSVAHFVNRLVFCMFAEDVGLLPENMFTRMLERTRSDPGKFVDYASRLFGAMSTGGDVGFEAVAWFNGGLFDDDSALPLDRGGIETAFKAAALDWSEIDPSILGTLFERGLDPDKRSQLGAHYTDRDKIMRLIEPLIVRPLLAEWEKEKAAIAAALERAVAVRSEAARTRRRRQVDGLMRAFLERLRRFTALDPACGSGNFLYLALHALKDIEHRVQLEAEAMGLQRAFPSVGPANVKGIEINAYAAELARVSVWIGEIQWMRRNGFRESRDPILKPLETIECRDAILGTSPAPRGHHENGQWARAPGAGRGGMELSVPGAQDRALEAQGECGAACGAGHRLGGPKAAVCPVLASVSRGQSEVRGHHRGGPRAGGVPLGHCLRGDGPAPCDARCELNDEPEFSTPCPPPRQCSWHAAPWTRRGELLRGLQQRSSILRSKGNHHLCAVCWNQGVAGR